MSLLDFYARNSEELLGLVGQHLSLVALSTGIAVVIGVPLGVALTRWPAWRGPVLGLANVFQTIPSLALFGFLIPLPFIGGIGATTAIVALVVYALLPIVRNTYTGIVGVDPAVREAGRGMGMTDWQLLTLVELPLGFGVMLAGVRVATVVGGGIPGLRARARRRVRPVRAHPRPSAPSQGADHGRLDRSCCSLAHCCWQWEAAPAAIASWSGPRTSQNQTCWGRSWRSRSSGAPGWR